MILTKETLNEYLQMRRIKLPDIVTKKILEIYGSEVEDDQGHIFEYSEQDIAEQLRKIIQKYQEGGNFKEVFV